MAEGDEELILNLKYPLQLRFAPSFAADIVKATREISGVNLDYTPRTLRDVDDIIESFRADNVPIAGVKETLFGFGCYVGEVFVRSDGGTWRDNSDEYKDVMNSPFLVQLPNDTVINPIGKVFKRFNFGEEDDLPYFYTVFSKRARKQSFWNRLFRGRSS